MAMTGTITVLFTDLVGSTELLSDLGDDDADRLRRIYFKILRDTVTHHSGREVKNLGDGIMAVFSSAIDALRCATDIQRQVHAHNEDKGASLRVRIGLEVGEPIAEEEDYFGTPVVIAKRLCDSAQGGQIVVSELVTRLIGSRGRFDFKDIGLLSLRGIEEAVPRARARVGATVRRSRHLAPHPTGFFSSTGLPGGGRRWAQRSRDGAGRGLLCGSPRGPPRWQSPGSSCLRSPDRKAMPPSRPVSRPPQRLRGRVNPPKPSTALTGNASRT